MTATDRQGGEREVRRPVDDRLHRLLSATGTATLAGVAGPAPHVLSSGLDDRTDALVRLAALVAMSAPATLYRSVVDAARRAGATDEEVIGTMIAVTPTVGLSRLIPAATGVTLALGYDVEAALEHLDDLVERVESPRGDR